MINIKWNKKMDLKDYSFIEGFPGIGLVGPMVINYMIDKLGMTYAGYLESDKFPPLIAIHKTIPMPPIRIYVSEKYKIITIFAEFQIPMELIYEVSDKINDFISENKISEVVSVNGMPYKISDKNDTDNSDMDSKAFAMTSKKELLENIKSLGISQIDEGVATGISALLMTKAIENNLNDVTILIPVNPDIIDPKYAESAIKYINKLLNLNIDIKELDKEAKEVESKIKDIIKKNKENHQTYKDSYNTEGPSMYA